MEREPKTHEPFEEKESRREREGFVSFNDIARNSLNQQSQYASRYIDGTKEGYPNLGEGLRFDGRADDYHDVCIHKDDVEEFVRRVKEYKERAGRGEV